MLLGIISSLLNHMLQFSFIELISTIIWIFLISPILILISLIVSRLILSLIILVPILVIPIILILTTPTVSSSMAWLSAIIAILGESLILVIITTIIIVTTISSSMASSIANLTANISFWIWWSLI